MQSQKGIKKGAYPLPYLTILKINVMAIVRNTISILLAVLILCSIGAAFTLKPVSVDPQFQEIHTVNINQQLWFLVFTICVASGLFLLINRK